MGKVATIPEHPGKSEDSISISWHIDDVNKVAPDLTESQCREVLRRVKQFHERNVGINWGVLSAHADAVRGI